MVTYEEIVATIRYIKEAKPDSLDHVRIQEHVEVFGYDSFEELVDVLKIEARYAYEAESEK